MNITNQTIIPDCACSMFCLGKTEKRSNVILLTAELCKPTERQTLQTARSNPQFFT